MRISLQNTGKRYNREWIFRGFNYQFSAGKNYAITGPNGSGKSTLLQVVAGAILHTEGRVEYVEDNERRTTDDGLQTTDNRSQTTDRRQQITDNRQQATGERRGAGEGSRVLPNENAYRQIAIAAPYLDLIEEMTAKEFLTFHAVFKPLTISVSSSLETVGLAASADKQIRYFSSGMKQRLKLAQAFFSNTSALLLDEPLTNLDSEGISIYKKLIRNHTSNRLVIVSSNDPQEYDFCDETISMADFK